MKEVFIPPFEVIQKFGFLIKGQGAISGLNFAKKIIRSNLNNESFRENCASTAASYIREIEVYPERGYRSIEFIS